MISARSLPETKLLETTHQDTWFSIRWLIWRELVVTTRMRVYWFALAVHMWLLTAFIVIWGDGVPVLAGTVFDQFLAIQLAILTAVMPWIACRTVWHTSRELSMLATVASCTPSRLVVARWCGLSLTLVALVASALPLASIALRISRLGPLHLARALLPAMLLCGFVAAISTAFVLTTNNRMTAWLLGTAATLAVALAFPLTGGGSMALVAASVVVIELAALYARTARFDTRSTPNVVRH
jgi:hypothetical protein